MTFLWLNFGIFNLRGHGDDPLVKQTSALFQGGLDTSLLASVPNIAACLVTTSKFFSGVDLRKIHNLAEMHFSCFGESVVCLGLFW